MDLYKFYSKLMIVIDIIVINSNFRNEEKVGILV